MAEIDELRSNLANYKVQLQQVWYVFTLFVLRDIEIRNFSFIKNIKLTTNTDLVDYYTSASPPRSDTQSLSTTTGSLTTDTIPQYHSLVISRTHTWWDDISLVVNWSHIQLVHSRKCCWHLCIIWYTALHPKRKNIYFWFFVFARLYPQHVEARR